MENFEKRFRWRVALPVLFAALTSGRLASLWGVRPVGASGQAAANAGLELSIVDAGTGQHVAARVRVRDQAGYDYAPQDAVEVPISKRPMVRRPRHSSLDNSTRQLLDPR
jgi:hypothetical protein